MRRSSSLHSIDDNIERKISNEKYQDVKIVADDITSVVSVGSNIDAVLAAEGNAAAAQAAQLAAETAQALAEAARDAAIAAETGAGVSANDALLTSYIAIAAQMTATADSYATEAEDVPVKIYTSNGDGTYTATDTLPVEYSSMHWSIKADLAVNNIKTDQVINAHTIGTVTDDHLDTLINISHSSGVITGCDLTDNGDGTVNITAGEALIRDSADELATIFSVEVPATLNLPISSGITNYLYVDYNLGNPVWAVTTNQLDINCIDKCLAYIVFRSTSGHFDLLDDRGHSIDVSRKTRALFRSFGRFIHVEGGSKLYSPSGLAIGVTAGAFFYTVTRINHVAFDTSIAGIANENVFEYFYRDGLGSWVATYDQKNVDNAFYDNGSGTLAAIGNAKFGVHWVYMINNDPSHLAVVYGQQQYNTIAEAEVAIPPSEIPPVIEGLGVLLGFVAVQEGVATIVNTYSAFATAFAASQATFHNGLAGLQGGTVDDYQHLTTAELNKLVNLDASTVPFTPTGNIVATDVQAALTELDTEKQAISEKGQANGYVPLNSSILIDAQYLPSYVDDVIEVATYANLPVTGETSKIYIVIADETSGGDTSTYRWTGSLYAMVSNTLSASDIKSLYESNADTNAFTDALLSKLNGIEPGATADQTAAEILALLLTVDGGTSGLDTQYLNAQADTAFARYGVAGTTFTTAQRTSITVEDNAIDFTGNNNFSLTATVANITATNVSSCVGQSGVIEIASTENITGWGSEFTFSDGAGGWSAANAPIVSGTEVFAYFVINTTTIRMGRVQ